MISGVVGGIGTILTVREAYKLVEEMIKNSTKMTWGEIIRETTSLSKELTEGKIEDIISLLNNEENLKEMEEYFKKCSSYELEEVMKDYIYLATFTLKIDLKDDERKEFADLFFKIFCSYIKKENQEMYDKLIINKKLNELLKNKIKYKTLKKEEDILKDNTELPFEKINLDFFDYEDEEFSKNLKEKIEKDEKTIYIEGSSKEETYYCVLSELKRMEKQDRKVYIITEREEWNKCDGEIKDGILISYFYSNEIYPIKDNINIFIFGRYENCSKRNKIILKRRLIKNLQKKLEEFYVGNKSQYIYNLIKRTNGIFSNLKRIILNAYFEPKWLEKVNNFDFDIVEKALFLGEWTEKDKENVASLIEMDYDLFIKKIQQLIILEDPFLIKIETFNFKYKLANSEEAWSYLKDRISLVSWENYKEKIINILSEIDDLYKEELKMDVLTEKDGQRKYSKELKNGLLRSLILYKNARVNSEEVNHLEFDSAIKNIFDNIINSEITPINKWAYISEHILLMCEIAPSVVMEKLENGLDTGLLDIMKVGEEYNSFGSNYYLNFLWTIEYLLQYEETATKAIDWLLSINDKNIKYSISNSPEGTLRHVFNTWYNEVFLTTDEKITLAEKAIKNYRRGWEIIVNELPKNGDVIVGELAKPIYSKYIDDIPSIDTIKISKNYMRLCIENIDNDVEKAIRLLDFLQYIDYFGLLENMIALLEKMMKELNDEKREKLKYKLRNIIFEYRFYEWQEISPQVINKINNFYNKIIFDNSIWNFAFLFRGDLGSFPLLEPTPFKNENYFKRNEEKAIKLIKEEFQNFKETGYDFTELLSIKVVENFYLFGKYIAEFYSENKYNEEICKKVLNTENMEIILVYAETIFNVSGNEELNKIVDLAFSLKKEEKLIIKITAKQLLDKTNQKSYPIIDKLNEDMQEMYWKNNRITFIENKETLKYVIENCVKYGNGNVFEYLVKGSNFISAEEYLEYLIKIMDKNNIDIRNISLVKYYVEEIFNKIYEKFYKNNKDIETFRKIAKIELYYRGVLPWNKLKCFVYLLKKEPNYYAEMINIIYKHEGEEEEELNGEEQKSVSNLFKFYYDIKFCPCTHETNNIDEIELENWVNKFEKLLEGQKQKKLLGMELGKLFAFSPQGNDGFYPHESVRKIIEKLKDQELKKSYIITILNKRGIYSPDAGITEKKLSKEYKENAKGLKFYPFTASIYNEISQDYMLQSQNERRRAEHEF